MLDLFYVGRSLMPFAPLKSRRWGLMRHRVEVEETIMGKRPQENADDLPPSPGGDPDQAPNDLPAPPSRENTGDTKNKKGYGHIGNKEVPRPAGGVPPTGVY
jgi:hypothetical protein